MDPNRIVLSHAEWRELIRRANEKEVARHRAEYRARLRARARARKEQSNAG